MENKNFFFDREKDSLLALHMEQLMITKPFTGHFIDIGIQRLIREKSLLLTLLSNNNSYYLHSTLLSAFCTLLTHLLLTEAL